MRNKSKVAALMAVVTAFALVAAIAPTALAGQSQVFFSDVNGNPKAQWSIGETLYVTVVAHNENRDDAKVEFIDAGKSCETHTQVSVPCIEIWNPNTKDAESNYGSLVLVETGANSGIFRSQNGLQILPIENDPGYNENGTIEVYNGDTLAVRYQGPSDDTDISLDLAKVGATDATVSLTNQAGQSQPMWRLGQHVYVTVEDADANLDPRTPDTLKGVTLWNPRCVWDALERQGSPRSDQPQPKPCEGTIAYDSALKNILGQSDVQVGDSLVLEETGPDTGVFRNVNGVRINDNFAEQGERQLFVNHKDTIAAFYRHPAIVGGQAPDEEPADGTRTDRAENENFIFERTVPTSVQPGETFTVSNTITVKQDTQAAVLRDGLPSGFSLASGNLRAVETGLSSGESFTHSYDVTAGATPGTFQIRGVTLDGSGVRPLPLTSNINVAAGGQATSQGLNDGSVSAQANNQFIGYNRSISGNPAPGGTFTVNVSVEANQDLQAVTVSESLPSGLTLDSGDLRAVELNLASGDTFTHSYTVQCAAGGGSFTISGEATPATDAGTQSPLSESTTVNCSEDGGGPTPPPSGVTGFYRGGGGYNDPQDFAMAQAKVGHLNPADLAFTDQNGNEIDEIEFGQDIFLTMEDTDQNLDTDHVETLCVQVFNTNGGREGDTPAFFRQFQDQLKDDPRSCLEDHGRDMQQFKTGVKLVETGPNTGVFRNPDGLKLIPICARSEEPMYGFETAPGETSQVPIHFAENPGTNNVEPGTFEDVDPWWQKVNPGDVLKDCYQTTPYIEEGRAEFERDPKQIPSGPNQGDVPGVVAAHAGDSIYAVYQDQIVDPHDVVFSTTDVASDHTFTGEENALQFVDADGNPVEDGQYQVGRDVFVRLEDSDRNVDSDVKDKLLILVLDRATGDWENLLLTETGPDTGVFMNDAGLSLQPASSPDEISINNNRLEVFDRDTIEAHYQDNYNAKDYTNAWVRLVPQPEGGPTGPGPGDGQPTTVDFTDAQGTELTDIAVGDDVYVTVEAPNASGNRVNVTVTNARTQESVEVAATNTSGDTFRTGAITTGAPGANADIAVADGDTLEASYQDVTDSIGVVTAEFNFAGATNFPNPLQNNTTFQAEGTGVASVSVDVYDLSGRAVASVSASGSSVMWDGTGAQGTSLSAGVYLYTVTAEGRDGTTATSDVMKLVILR